MGHPCRVDNEEAQGIRGLRALTSQGAQDRQSEGKHPKKGRQPEQWQQHPTLRQASTRTTFWFRAPTPKRHFLTMGPPSTTIIFVQYLGCHSPVATQPGDWEKVEERSHLQCCQSETVDAKGPLCRWMTHCVCVCLGARCVSLLV